jgi:ribosomal protein S21
MIQVEVKNNLEGALLRLKRAMQQDGILKEIRIREQNPSRAERRKEKLRIAARRRIHAQRKREARQNDQYDKVRVFNWQHRIG